MDRIERNFRQGPPSPGVLPGAGAPQTTLSPEAQVEQQARLAKAATLLHIQQQLAQRLEELASHFSTDTDDRPLPSADAEDVAQPPTAQVRQKLALWGEAPPVDAQEDEPIFSGVSLATLLEGDLPPHQVLGGMLSQVLKSVAPEVFTSLSNRLEEPPPDLEEQVSGGDPATPRPSDNVVASNLESILNRSYRQDASRKQAAAKLMLVILKAHGAYTYEHCMRLVDLGLALAKELGYQDDQLYQEIEYGVTYKDVGEAEYFMTRQSPQYKQALAAYLSGLNLAQGAMLHDFGKIKVPPEILYKPSMLTPDEVHIMQQHPVWGADILAAIPPLAHAIPATRHHHERWDARGYPDSIGHTDIPLSARIVAVVDSFDAMVADRPYRKSLTLAQARGEILRGAGSQFDPNIANTFARIVDKVWDRGQGSGVGGQG